MEEVDVTKFKTNISFLGVSKRLYNSLRRSVCWLVGPSVRGSVPILLLPAKFCTWFVIQLVFPKRTTEDGNAGDATS
jgi:hypothetical protein